MKINRTISLPPEIAMAAKELSDKKGVNISFECETLIRNLAKQFKVKIK